jgi:hypothetical protein
MFRKTLLLLISATSAVLCSATAEQPIFDPVLEEEYAVQIAQGWNTRNGERGFVLRFEVDREYLARYPIQTIGARIHREYWIPAEDLHEFNQKIVGTIDLLHSFDPNVP